MNAIRLLSEFHGGSLGLADTWRRMLDPTNVETILTLAEEAGRMADAASNRLRSRLRGRHRAPDDAGDGRGAAQASTSRTTCGLAWSTTSSWRPGAARWTPPSWSPRWCPIYFGRVGSFVIENRHLTTAEAEERVERQAREFELLKPYLVERWEAQDEERAGGADAGDDEAQRPGGRA